MKIRVHYPSDFAIETQDRREFIELATAVFATSEAIRSNTVLSLTGKAQDEYGKSEGISNPTDRALLATLRRASDVVLVGGNTARVEAYSKPRSTRLAVTSKSGDLGAIPAIADASGAPVMVFLPEPALSEVRSGTYPSQIEFFELEAGLSSSEALVAATTALSRGGFKSILHESGLTQIKHLAAEGILEEICLTITKKPEQSFRPADVSLDLLGIEAGHYKLKALATDKDAIFMSWRIATEKK